MSHLFTAVRGSLILIHRAASVTRTNPFSTIYATVKMRRSARISSQAEGAPAAPVSQTTTTQKRRRSPEPPSTPAKKRTRPVQPVTPTPTAVGLITENGDHTLGKKPRNAAVTRLADPNLSNATLLSPETSRVVASRDIELVSPTKTSKVRTTTANLLDTACAHLIKVDERMRPLIEKHHCRVFSPEGLAEKIDPFESLTSGIISQQVSGAAAKSIKAKFVALFHKDGEDQEKRFPLPSEVAVCSVEHLRTAGLSQRKAEYIQGLAEKFTNGDLSAQLLHDAPYEEVLEKLIAVRGLGKWSVEMFACFALKRMDVFSLGDLGVQRGMAAFVGRDVAKLKSKGGKWKYMSEKEMSELSEQFAPYRSLFMWYMWRVEETDISTLE